jgi:hypothetical protein
MSCERYWRDGIVLVERGLDDPHRDGCEDCTRAHASRQELIETIPWIGASYTGDPDWQAKVWRQIDEERAPAPWRWRWQLASVLTVACAFALWISFGRVRPDGRVVPDLARTGDAQPQFQIVHQGVAMRSKAPPDVRVLSAVVDDHLRFTVSEASDVWIYRAGRLVLQCPAPRSGQASSHVSDGCVPAPHGMVVELALSIPGTYHVIITTAPVAWRPSGRLDEDRAALESAKVPYQIQPLPVR